MCMKFVYDVAIKPYKSQKHFNILRSAVLTAMFLSQLKILSSIIRTSTMKQMAYILG